MLIISCPVLAEVGIKLTDMASVGVNPSCLYTLGLAKLAEKSEDSMSEMLIIATSGSCCAEVMVVLPIVAAMAAGSVGGGGGSSCSARVAACDPRRNRQP